MEFGILGPLEVVGRDGPVVVRGAKRRGLLAYLLVHAGETVSLDRLVDDLWDQQPSSGARGTVQSYLSGFRKLVPADDDVTLETRPGGYVLNVPTERLDAACFERLCAQSASETDAATRLDLVEEALALWRGTPLAEFAGSAWADVEATRLESRRLQALQQRMDARFALGRHGEAIPELERLVGEYRLDERFWAQLMVAYYRTGRQADALRAYGRVRSVLADELGLEPGAELVELERQILDHDPALTATPASAGLVEPLPAGVVTFVLTDVEGSTQLWDAHPQATATAMARHEELVAATVGAHRGHLVKSRGEGDSTLSVFPRASDAAAAAVALRDVLAVEAWPDGLELRTRVALHTGEAQLRGGDYYGGTLNRAARIRALAAGGEVVCSRATADLVADTLPGGVELREVGTYDLEGLRRAETVYALAPRSVSDADHARPRFQRPAAGEGQLPLPARLGLEGMFVGRDREGARLATAFETVRDGEGRRVVLVAGEPGVGKTTLAARFARAAYATGAAVLYGHCDEGLGIPYQPWAETLAHLVRHAPPAVLGAHVAARGDELARLVPDLAQRVRVPTLASADPESDRYRLFGAVVDLLARASSDAPVVLVLDDLHWADRPTLELLRHVVGAEAPLRLLLVATYRDTDISDDHPLAATLAALHREPGVERVPLRGLDPDSIGALLAATAGHDLDADDRELRDALAAETDGNPFFVTEVLHHLVETGALRRDKDHRWAGVAAAPMTLPPTVQEVIIQRVTRLGDETRRLLSRAAVIGRDFDLDLLAAVTDLDAAVVLDAVEAATTAALVRPAAGGTDRYTFVHALVEHALVATLSPARRRRVHARIADALEARCGDEPGDRIGELARHWIAADEDASKAIEYSSRAGAYALARLAPDDALRWYRQAVELLERSGEPDDVRRGAVLVGLGDAQRLTGDPAYRETFLAAADLARRRDDTDLLVRAVIANSRGMWSHAYQVDTDRVTALEAARTATEGQATRERALVLATLAAELAGADRDRMRLVADAAVELAQRLGDDPTLVTVIARTRPPPLRAPDSLARRAALADEAVAAAERTGDPALRWYAASMGISPPLESGDIDTVHQRLDVLDDLAREAGQPFIQWISAGYRAQFETLAGRLDQAEHSAREMLRIGVASGQPDAPIFYGHFLIAIRRHQGRLAELVDLIERVVADYPGPSVIRADLADCYCDAGRAADAQAILEADALDAVPFDAGWTTAMTLYAKVAACVGDERAAATLVDLLEPWRDQVATTGSRVHGSLAHPLGQVLATIGRYNDAEDAFAQAEAVHERIGAPILLAETRLAWARLLCDRDHDRDRALARTLARAAHTVATELGAGSIEQGARELLASLDSRKDRSAI